MLILQKGRFLLILFFKRVKKCIKSSDNLPRSVRTITKSFFSSANVTGFSVSLWLRKFLMQLSINLIENALSFNIFFKWYTSKRNLENSKTIKDLRNNKVKIKPTLYSSKIKPLKFEYTQLNLGLWYRNRCFETFAGFGS